MNQRCLFKINKSLEETRHAEEELCKLFDTKHALLMTSGHAALTSALIALGVGPGDEVIVPAYTYIATAMAVVAAGAIPVIADVDETLTLDPVDTERKVTKNTKCIIPVHIQGFPSNMDALTAIAEKYNLVIVEDACQADGASYHGKRLGTIGNAGAYSFNYFKIITAGEGGALVTNDKRVFERALIYHDSSAVAFFGEQLSNVEEKLFCGNEYRTNEISSAILRIQLQRLDSIIADLRKNKKIMMDELSDVCTFIPSNDIEGDLGTTLAIRFDDKEKALAVAKNPNVKGTVPINTGKHVYTNWTPILNKTGAFNPLMDPFKMEANKDIIPDYRLDMCEKTLDLLSRTVYIAVDPDWTSEQLTAKINGIRAAVNE
ncbi:MAG: aminotransferase class I/II-fold pyridoxal phosphate-dependent enzyme [Ruminococcaceae bacterium]|nr:aminotransferase class I/II-fold pyridoxal phosphate-dependent enzyme [Oscillospiraceae bacterium]